MVKYMETQGSGFNNWKKNQSANNEQKKSPISGFLWWGVIFLLAWWLFSTWFGPQKSDVQTTEPAVVEDVSNVPGSMIENEQIGAKVQGLRISNIELKNYKQGNKDDGNVALLSGENTFAEVGLVASGTTAPTATTLWRAPRMIGAPMFWKNADGIEFKRTVTINDYVINISDEVKNNANKDVTFMPYASILRDSGKDVGSVETGAVSFTNNDIEYNNWNQMAQKSFAYQTKDGFVGFADQYWETIVSLKSADQTIRTKKIGSKYQVDATSLPVSVAAGQTAVFETKLFAGPRDQNILGAAAATITGINQTIDYGWFWFLSRPMLWALNALNDIVMNYGIAIILLTIALRVLMWPLTRKSYTSMTAMQKMQPELAKIQKLYANDKARQQMEMMKLYSAHKTSPMSGCLPMLLQIPIFFALYKALLISVPMRMAGFLWISDLAVMDQYFILPIIMGATMWYQQKLQSVTPAKAAASDPMAQTQKVMKWMPLLFTAMFAWMPAGLVLYWTVSNLFGILQMWVIKRNKE